MVDHRSGFTLFGVRALLLDSGGVLTRPAGGPADSRTDFEIFPDVLPALRALRERGIPMAVVSDAGAGLPGLHAALGIEEFFDAYAVSEVLGCVKPDPRMYHHASDQLGFDPRQCLVVDDDPGLVAAAVGLGYAGRVMDRDGDAPARDVPFITSLTQVLDLI